MMRDRAFTLVELLVVIAIISILSVITYGQFSTAKMKARDVQRKADLHSLSKALSMYFADYGYFPLADEINDIWGGEFVDSTGYVYMKVMPTESKLSTAYCYVVSADRKSFGIFFNLENTQDSDIATDRERGIEGPYSQCGSQIYNYGIASPNITIEDL